MSVLKAVELLGKGTRGTFAIWELAGDGFKRAQRAAIMSELLGKKTPQAKSGVIAMKRAFYELAKVTAGGYAGEDQLAAWCRKMLAAEEKFQEEEWK